MTGTIKNKATFIAGSPRSGTTLMAALLDDHPELLVFPEEYLYLQPRNAPNASDRDLLTNVFKDKVLLRLQGKKGFLDALHQENRNYEDFDYHRFQGEVNECFRTLIAEKEGASVTVSALISLVYGYAHVIDRQQYSRWVVKHPNYELHWKRLVRDFPNARIIYLIRDPREVILSRTLKRNKKKYLKRGGKPGAWKSEKGSLRPSVRFLTEWDRSVMEFLRMSEAYPEHILPVRYEDLVSSPHQCMREVSEFLGVLWHESLLSPSFLGSPWNGNSMQERTFQGVNRSTKSKTHEFPPHHLWQIDAWLGDMMAGKPGEYVNSHLIDRVNVRAVSSWLRGESVVSFFRNRLRMLSNQRRRQRVRIKEDSV
jgi:hypothetical protein